MWKRTGQGCFTLRFLRSETLVLQGFQTIIPTMRAGIIKNSDFAHWERFWKGKDRKLSLK
jgi:hypothetical protein